MNRNNDQCHEKIDELLEDHKKQVDDLIDRTHLNVFQNMIFLKISKKEIIVSFY